MSEPSCARSDDLHGDLTALLILPVLAASCNQQELTGGKHSESTARRQRGSAGPHSFCSNRITLAAELTEEFLIV